MRYIVIKSNVFLPDDLAAHEHAHDGRCHPPARPAGGVAEAVETADVRVEIGVHLHAVGAELPLGGSRAAFRTRQSPARPDRVSTKEAFSASYVLNQRPERNAPAADKTAGTAQEGEKDGTAEAEPSFQSEIRQVWCYPFFMAITSVISAAPRGAPFPAVFGTPPETDPDRPC